MIQTISNNIPTPDYRLGAEQFCYWLQGFFEMTDATELTPEQVKMLKEHLNLVFIHKAQAKTYIGLVEALKSVGSSTVTTSTMPGAIYGPCVDGNPPLVTVC